MQSFVIVPHVSHLATGGTVDRGCHEEESWADAMDPLFIEHFKKPLHDWVYEYQTKQKTD